MPDISAVVYDSIDGVTTSASLFEKIGRTVDLVSDFGAVGDGSTDNAAALARFGDWARTESNAGRSVHISTPPGTYNFNGANCFGMLFNIKRLIWDGNGATFQNTYDTLVSGANGNADSMFGRLCYPDQMLGDGHTINNTTAGATTVTLKTPAEHSNYAVGDWILIGSLSIQSYGFPQNLDMFDFAKITAKNTTTGVLTLTPPIRNAHRDDYPQQGNINIYGDARIWQLKGGTEDARWDIHHTYRDMIFGLPPNETPHYYLVEGQYVKFERCTMALGPAVTISDTAIFEDCIFEGPGEPDKLVNNFIMRRCHLQEGMAFQSSSINNVVMEECRSDDVVIPGQAKSVYIRNPDFHSLQEGGIYGLNRSLVIDGGIIRSMTGPFRQQTSTGVQEVDGVDVTYADGVFSVDKGSGLLSIYWNGLPGMQFYIAGPSDMFPGDIGVGTILEVTEDNDNWLFITDLPYATLPAWASGVVGFQRAGYVDVRRVGGCDAVRTASEACAKGKAPWEYRRLVFTGVTAPGTIIGLDGDLIRFRFKVIRATAIASATMTFTQFNAYTKTAMGDPKPIVFTLDLTVAGQRDYTQIALTGKTGSDALTLDGVAQTTLPIGRWCHTSMTVGFSYTPSSYDPHELPVVEVEFELDSGMFRKGIPVGAGGGGLVVAGAIGQLP